MIDEKRVIKKLQSRIDDFVLKHPDKKDCEAVQTVEEFIQMLEEECKEQKNGWILCSDRLPEEHDTKMKKFKGASITGISEADDVDCFCFKVYIDPDCNEIIALEEFNETWFLTQSEAEAKLEELRGNQNGKV